MSNYLLYKDEHWLEGTPVNLCPDTPKTRITSVVLSDTQQWQSKQSCPGGNVASVLSPVFTALPVFLLIPCSLGWIGFLQLFAQISSSLSNMVHHKIPSIVTSVCLVIIASRTLHSLWLKMPLNPPKYITYSLKQALI